MKTVKDYRITLHGVEHSQYFQGHGVSFSKYDTCATGIGSTEQEALDDALEQLAQDGIDMDGLNTLMLGDGWTPSDVVPECVEDQEEDNELHVYVSVDVEFKK